MSDSDKLASLKRAFRYLVVLLRGVPASARAGLIEHALVLIKAGFSFDPAQVDEKFPDVKDIAPQRVSHQQVRRLARALQCSSQEEDELMVAVFPTYIFGRYLRKLRNRKGWSRGEFVLKLGNRVPSGVIAGERIREGLLQEIEEGRKAKILWPVAELFISVLECNYLDEFKLWLAAGKYPWVNSVGEISKEIEPLVFASFLMWKHSRGGALLTKSIIDNPGAFFGMTAVEILVVFERCLELLDRNDGSEKDDAKE